MSCADTDFFFFFFNAYAEERTRREGRQNSPLASQYLHPLRCMQKRDSMSVPRDVQKCEQEGLAAVSGSERIAPCRQDQSRVEAYTTGFSKTSIFIPTLQRPHEWRPMASRREQVSALFFRSLNTTSSHRMFSMGYRRAKSTQGNANFQKRNFLANNFGISTRGP